MNDRLQPIDRALHAYPSAIQDVRVDHRGTDVCVPEQLLDCPDVVSSLEQMRCEGMTQDVAADALRQPNPPRRLGNGPLNRRLVQMKPRWWPESRIAADACGRKDELPAPLGCGVRKFLFERKRQHHASESERQISRMTGANVGKVLQQPIAHEVRQHHATVLLPLAATNRDLASLEIDILHTQLQTLLQTQSGAVEQRGDQPWHTVQLTQYSTHFVGSQHDRDVYRSLRMKRGSDDTKILSQHLVLQEHDGAECLILCRRRHLPLHR
jgi:hypothetical protein